MNYRLSEDALADLDEVWAYIAADNIDAADRIIASFIEAFKLLAERPLIGHRREEVTDRPVLFWPVGSYTIVYRPETQPLRVIAVLHGARDLTPIVSTRE